MIFFDVDETLLDFKTSEFLGVQALFDAYRTRFPYTEEEFYMKWCEIGERHFTRYLSGKMTFEEQKIARVKEIFGLVDLAPGDVEAASVFQIYLTHFQDNWRPFDDVLPCLKALSGRRLGIISNGDTAQQSAKLVKMGIRDSFECVITAADVGVAKPDPYIFEMACRRAGESPENCMYVGDHYQTDILPCVKLGMKGVWLNRSRIMDCANESATQIYSLTELVSHVTQFADFRER